MEITTSSLSLAFSSRQFLLAWSLTLLSLLLSLFAIRSKSSKSSPHSDSRSLSSRRTNIKTCNCCCHVNGAAALDMVVAASVLTTEKDKIILEKQTGASMMEQLVPEITTHALTYLDYLSLCRLSMTNSLMRKAANDDNAWKALYHKDFTVEQDSVIPSNGWKAYYASTRAVVNVNAEFFSVIKERSLQAMSRIWLNADYVKCIHASAELFSGYNGVMQGWQLAFNWEQGIDIEVRDVRVRVLTEMAWVSMKTYVDMEAAPFAVTNVFEFHNGRWYLVHHHNSLMLIDADMDQQMVHP